MITINQNVAYPKGYKNLFEVNSRDNRAGRRPDFI